MSSDLGACFLCQSTDGGPLSHVCAECKAEICPTCVVNKQLSACPACGDTEQNWQTIQKLGSFAVACGTARDWLRGVGITNKPETVASPACTGAPSPPAHNTNCTSQTNLTSKEILPPAVVGEVLDWLKEEVDGSWLEDVIVEDAVSDVPETLELVDAGKKCTSVIGPNGDYRSGMARDAVAYLLKNSMAANKAKEKKTLLKLPNGNSNYSTAVPSEVGSGCPSQRSEKPEAFACPTQRSVKPEEPPQSWRTVQPSESGSSEPTWHTSTPTDYSQPQSPCHVYEPAQCSNVDTRGISEKHCVAIAETETGTAASMVQGWSVAALAKGFESLTLPMMPSWSNTVNNCSKMNIGHREVMEHNGISANLSEPPPTPPEMLPKPGDESPNEDDWAASHFAALESTNGDGKSGVKGQEAATATADDECRSCVTSVFFPPVVPPLVFPKSELASCAPAMHAETLQTTHSKNITISARSEFEAKEDSDNTTCPKGHERRWHGWHCGICDKRGSGLRFSCVECLDANLCITCKKTFEAQTQVSGTCTPDLVCAEAQPIQSLSAIAEAPAAEAPPTVAAKTKSVDRPARSSSSTRRERTGASASKSVLSVQTTGTSSAAQLLGGLAQQQNSSKAERTAGSASKSVLSGQTFGTSSAAQLLGGVAQQPGSRPRSSSSKKAFESKSLVGAEGSTQRRSGQRAGGSVLSVKNTSSSAAAGLLGPLLEQKAKP